MRLGSYIRDKRTEHGMSLADLAEKLSAIGYRVTKGAVGHWESGRNDPPIEDETFIRALAIALHIDSQTLWQHIATEYTADDLSPNARRAADIVQLMPDEKQELALNLLEAML